MDCSIIVCSHNRGFLLEGCLKSILKQDTQHLKVEVIIVDNNSSDETKKIVESAASKSHLNLKYFFENPLGLSYARNKGLREACGKIVVFIDDDARPNNKNWLKNTLQAFDDPNIGIAGGSIDPIWPDGTAPSWLPKLLFAPLSIKENKINTNTLVDHHSLPWGANIAFRRSFLGKYGLSFDTNLGRCGEQVLSGEETLLALELLKRGKKAIALCDGSVSHIIDKKRLSKDWLLKQAKSQGASDAYIANKILTKTRILLLLLRKILVLTFALLLWPLGQIMTKSKIHLVSNYIVRRDYTLIKAILWQQYTFLKHAKVAPLLRKLQTAKLTRLDNKTIPNNKSEIRVFLKIKNEERRLNYFFKYYKDLGADRFFVIDNNSNDESVNYCLKEDDVHLFSTKEDFSKQLTWFDYLLKQYGKKHWCLIVDPDEFLVFYDSENTSLKELCAKLKLQGYSSLHAVQLDLYSKDPIANSELRSGDNPLEKFCYFDKDLPDKRADGQWLGGMRKRVFDFSPELSKHPLFFFDKNVCFSRGVHQIFNTLSSYQKAVLLHIKYDSNLIDLSKQESIRGAYYKRGVEYTSYASSFEKEQSLNLYDTTSVKLSDSRQLLELGFIQD